MAKASNVGGVAIAAVVGSSPVCPCDYHILLCCGEAGVVVARPVWQR